MGVELKIPNRHAAVSSVLRQNGDMIEHSQDGNMIKISAGSEILSKYYHDVRGPLRNIASFLQIIRLELKKTEQFEQNNELLCYINRAIDCLDVLNDLNHHVFAFDTPKVCAIQLVHVLERVRFLMPDAWNRYNVHIAIDSKVPNLIGEMDDFVRIFKNLIENVVVHGDVPTVNISIELVECSTESVKFLFKDNGRKLTNEERSRIKNALIGNKIESHWGLEIVGELMRKMHGQISLVPSSGGCVYEVCVPKYSES